MKIICISNYFTHHQKPISDALFELTQGNYLFLATEKMSDDRKTQGWTIQQPPYVYELDMSDSVAVCRCINLINDADTVIQGHLYDNLIAERVKQGKLTFIYNERLYKSTKRYLKAPLYLYKGLKYHNCYVLTASAYTPFDYSITRSYIDRCYKFGYFPATKEYNDVDKLLSGKSPNTILWVARVIDWKHPEIPIAIAKRLKDEGYNFNLKMIGTGDLLDLYRSEVSKANLSECVTLTGLIKPEEVRLEMEHAGIFLFTSDRNEGWGAVLNEAMNSGCAVVVSHEIGAVPYLVRNGVNGQIYQDGFFEDVYSKVKRLLDNPAEQQMYGRNAISTIEKTWNANTAARNLIQLINDIRQGTYTITDGPCSKAEIIKDNWYKCQ